MTTQTLPEQESAELQTPARPKRTWRRWALTFPLRLATYFAVWLALQFITIGPFFWTWYRAFYLDGSRWVVGFYMPLLYLCQYEPVAEVVNNWINWWIL